MMIKDQNETKEAWFEKILFSYEKGIFRYIYTLVGQRQDAEDLTQETFVRVYKNFGSVNPQKNLKGWLYRIATNITYDWFRRKKIRPELFIIDDPDRPFETIDEECSYNKIETNKDVQDALAKIKVIYRSVLLLFYWEGLKYEEIALVLGLPVNTLKTNIMRAKQELKKVLEGNIK